MLLSLRLGLAVSLATLFFPFASAAAQSCPSLTIPSSALPATQPNSRFFNEVFGIARPSLTINGFTCNRPGGDCRRGLGLKEIVEAVHSTSATYSAVNTHAGTGPVIIDRSTVLPVHRRLLEDAQEGWIADPSGTTSPYDKVLQNAYVLQARGYAALVSYLVEASGFSAAQANACTGATAPQYQLRAHSTERSGFLYALKTSAGWLPEDAYKDDATKWRLVVADVARSIDLYLALENAYVLKSPAYVGFLLTETEKTTLHSNLHSAVSRVEEMYDDGAPYNRYTYEAGNWALTVQASLAYATLAMQTTPDGCWMLSTWNYPCNRTGLLQRGFRTLRQVGQGNHDYGWSFGTGNGRRFWSEGPYYFQIMLDQVIPFWHSVRVNNLYSQAGFSIPNDPFYDPFVTAPINWLADITTPLGETPPLDDGNRRPMYNAMILRWQSGYGDEAIGQKFAWIADRVRVPGTANEIGFAAAGADVMTVHAEATVHLHRVLQQIRAAGMQAGVALNPATPLVAIEDVLGDVDLVLVMSVNPGFGGQAYIPGATGKIARLRQMREAARARFAIEVDGGVKASNIAEVVRAGADVVVAGSAVFGGDVAANVRALVEAASAPQQA